MREIQKDQLNVGKEEAGLNMEAQFSIRNSLFSPHPQLGCVRKLSDPQKSIDPAPPTRELISGRSDLCSALLRSNCGL